LEEFDVNQLTRDQEHTITLATTWNRNEQQNDARNNAEFWAMWKKTTWKNFE
jgi:hypothetical protein